MNIFTKFLEEVDPGSIEQQMSKVKRQLLSSSEETMTEIVNYIITKVSNQPADFSPLYIYICRLMSDFEARDPKGDKAVIFKDVLETQCLSLVVGLLQENHQWTVASQSTAERLYSLTSFVGELYVRGMFTDGALHQCLQLLLGSGSEAALRYLSRVLKTTGGMEVPGACRKDPLDDIFQDIHGMITRNSLSPATKFMLCDLCDRRQNGWKPGREVPFYTFNRITSESRGNSSGTRENAMPQVVNSQPSKSNKLERELTEPAATSSTIKLKYVYQKDQWSPINPNGKKRYDRRFLLSIQPDCINLKPKGLPDVPDIILEKPKPCPLRIPKPFTHPHSGDRGSKATKEAPREENDLQLRPADREGHALERDVHPKVRATGVQGLSRGPVTPSTDTPEKSAVKEEATKQQSKKKKRDKTGYSEDVSKEGETKVQSEDMNNGDCNGLQDVVKEPPAKEPISEEVFRERCREAITGYMQLRNPPVKQAFI